MLSFRTEIRNNPKEQTIKIYLSQPKYDTDCKNMLQKIEGIREIEVCDSVARNRVEECLTVFKNDDIDINSLQKRIEYQLDSHFAYD